MFKSWKTRVWTEWCCLIIIYCCILRSDHTDENFCRLLRYRWRGWRDINRLVRRAAVLPLLPMQNIEDVWLHTLEDIDNADTNINTVSFTDYVTEQWVENNRDLWNHHNTEGPRTTNHLEGWHHKLKSHVQHPHPNIYNLIKLIQSQQSATEIRLIQYAAGGKRIQRKRKYVQIDNRLATLKERLTNGAITPEEFADSASHLLHLG